jgi:DNA-binding NarL/FixJ family response regulator
MALDILEAKNIILSKEDVPLPIRRSAWRLFRHELEKRDPQTRRAITPKKALNKTLGWMLLQAEKQARDSYKINALQRRLLYLIVVEGYTQDQAAIELNRSHETVKRYCINLRKQLGVDSFFQVVAIAIFEGWIPPPSLSQSPKS